MTSIPFFKTVSSEVRFSTERGLWQIEEIRDTRSFDWETGKPDPATGHWRPCDCCGKEHVIHVTVRHCGTRKTMVVGSTCAKRLVYNSRRLSTDRLRFDAWTRACQEEAARIAQAFPGGMTRDQAAKWVEQTVAEANRPTSAQQRIMNDAWQLVLTKVLRT